MIPEVDHPGSSDADSEQFGSDLTQRASLALVVIGRNPGSDLQRLLDRTESYAFSEVIFADSASTDGSADEAERRGVKVVRVTGRQSAAAARAAGTLACRSEWILYLDSDMVPDLECVRRVHSMLETVEPPCAGFAARTLDRFRSGGSRLRHARARSDGSASHFGGAVVLNRSAVVAVGNWNPRVVANEEFDLHARLRAAGYHVGFVDVVLVEHWTPHVSFRQKLAALVNWRGQGGFRYGAPGLALRSCWEQGAAAQLIALNPDHFVAVPLSLIAVALGLTTSLWLGGGLLVCLWVWIGLRRGWPYLLPSYLLFPQLLVGWLRYENDE